MGTKLQRIARRTDALSKERIVEAATEILDTDGEIALTFRALAARLATGSGAIYRHVASKNDLLATATDDIIARVMTDTIDGAEPREAIRTVALKVLEAIEAHPWVGAQLSREPWWPAMVRIFENIGGHLQALGLPERAQFTSASVLLNYILGFAGQNAAKARLRARETDRSTFFVSVADRWPQRDPAKYPLVNQVAARLGERDDRGQFLAGIDLILAGIETAR